MRRILVTSMLVVAGGLGLAGPTEAAPKRRSVVEVQDSAEHPKSGYYHKAPRVRGFLARRGGYSYSYADTINTYGMSRSLFGGANVWRDPSLDRQTSSGPFDHGFFFDSGMGPRGGDSPYPH